MRTSSRCLSVGIVFPGALLLTALVFGTKQDAPRVKVQAYPDVIPKNVSFETVVSSQPYPPVKYPVPIIGWKEHSEEFHVTPNGAVVAPAPNPETPGASPSKEPGLYVVPLVGLEPGSEPALLVPDNVDQDLVDGYKPGVRSAWTREGLAISQLAFCTLLEGAEVKTGREPLLAFIRFTVTNPRGTARKVNLWLNFGEAVYGHSIFQVPPRHPQALSYDWPFVSGISGKAVAVVLSAPKGGAASFHPLSAESRAGLGAKSAENSRLAEDKKKPAKPAPGNPRENSLRFKLDLAAGESASVDLAIPYYSLEKEALRGLAAAGTFDSRLALFRDYWRNELNRRAVFNLPEPRIDNSYRACLAYNLILTDRSPVNGALLIHPDATHYEFVWAGDSACILQAYDRLGYHDEAASYLRYFLERQGSRKPEGDVSSAEGFLPGDQPGLRWMGENGFILWAMAEHYKLSGDKEWLKRVAPAMIKSAEWIIRERLRTKTLVDGRKPRHYGLLPKGRTSDNPEIDHLYWTDNYSYGGLRGAADALDEIGLMAEAARLAAEADDYEACIRESIQRSIVPEADPPFVPLGPYKNRMPNAADLANDWYSLCGPIYMAETGILDPRGPEAGWINATVEKYVMASGLPTLSRPGFIDPHYVYNQALSQLLRGETEKFLWSFYSMFAYGQSRSTYSTVECSDIFTGESGESWEALRQPHEHSNSRVIAMVRTALLLEDGEKLRLFPGTPRGWLEPGKVIEVNKAPTVFGEVGLRAESLPGVREVRYTIEPPARRKASIALHLRPPAAFGAVQSVEMDGRPVAVDGEVLDLGPLSAPARIVCRYAAPAQPGPLDPVPDDRLLEPSARFPKPSPEHLKKCFAHVHALSEAAYHGDGVWADRDPQRLARLPEASRPLNVIDPKFPPLYRNTAWRVLGYAAAVRADDRRLYRDRVRAGADYLVREQRPDGSYLYWRGREDGWPNSPHLLFCTASPGLALLDAYHLTGEKRYLEAARRTGEWLVRAVASPNNNYNSLAVWSLCELYRETKDPRLLENALAKTVQGVYPNQLPNGAWSGHNSWIFYHAIIVRGFAALYGVLPDGHPEKPELRRRLVRAINHLIVEQRANGFLRSCFDEEEWKKSRAPGNAYSVHREEKVCPFAIHALICVLDWTDLDGRDLLYGLLSAPPQDELVQGQEGMMHLAYGAALAWRADR